MKQLSELKEMGPPTSTSPETESPPSEEGIVESDALMNASDDALIAELEARGFTVSSMDEPSPEEVMEDDEQTSFVTFTSCYRFRTYC